MHPKWIIFFITSFVLMTVLSGIIEMSYFGVSEQGTLQSILNEFSKLAFNNPVVGLASILIGFWNVLRLLFIALIWDYSFFTGQWQIVKYAFFFPISIGFVVSVIFAVRGTSAT